MKHSPQDALHHAMVLDELHLAEERWIYGALKLAAINCNILEMLQHATANSPVLRLSAVVNQSDIDLASSNVVFIRGAPISSDSSPPTPT